ncbi:AEC family transporter [Kaarinaea lacus]
MSEFLHIFSFAFSVTGPIFIILALGIILARAGVITDAFIDAGSKLVFNVTLPALLFITISKTNLEHIANVSLIVYGLIATFTVFVLLEWLAGFFIHPPQDRGVVVQGALRSNMGIVGLAYSANAYGDVGLAAASIYLGPVTILFNVLAVITLNRSLNKHRSVAGTLFDIVKNPLILGIVLAIPVAWSHWQLPAILLQSGEYFAQMTLPLALLCTGASLSVKALRKDSRNAVIASIGKLLMVPFIITLGGYWLGFRDMDLGILFLMTSSPTAAASYIMVRAMNGNAALAANIIALTTFGSILVASIGVALLRHQGLM